MLLHGLISASSLTPLHANRFVMKLGGQATRTLPIPGTSTRWFNRMTLVNTIGSAADNA